MDDSHVIVKVATLSPDLMRALCGEGMGWEGSSTEMTRECHFLKKIVSDLLEGSKNGKGRAAVFSAQIDLLSKHQGLKDSRTRGLGASQESSSHYNPNKIVFGDGERP